MTLHDSRALAEARAHADVFFEPPVAAFDALDFTRPQPLIETSYDYARTIIANNEQVAAIRSLVS